MVEFEWTAHEIQCLRHALRLSKPEFARRVRVTTRTLRLWESGETTRLHAASRRLLYQVLEEADEDAVVRFRTLLDSDRRTPMVVDASGTGSALGPYAREANDEDMKRREFGKAAATGAALALLGGSGRVGMTDVQRLLAAIGELEEKDQRFGSGMFVDRAVRDLAVAKNMLDVCSYDGATAAAFASATGELAVLTGWLAFDSDRQSLARRCYADAMALGTEADNDELIAHTCLYAANQSIRLSRTGEASPHRASPTCRPSPRTHAWTPARPHPCLDRGA
ncbi:helix-turn-helix domain-containing protein [Nocardia sp. N2S4-5]|uniref:helix-turn-helix domain-containing protein n=1 Tax=Nocardia sp. N2S4-5 TaxID=3351565 RepID=UPI0037CE0CDC